MELKLVNIGCGCTYHESWLNYDMNPATPDVLSIDLRKGIPLDDQSVDACYASHVLEHLSPAEGRQLLSEMKRVLKPGGIVRIVVPDLEQIVAAYLASLKATGDSNNQSVNPYDWMILELLDQMVRSHSGGEMGRFMRTCPEQMRSFIRSRIGAEADLFWDNASTKKSWMKRILSKPPTWYLDAFRFFLLRSLAYCIAGERGRAAVQEGWFRVSGEVHRWMYDHFSLKRMFAQSGFDDIEVCTFNTSRIPQFSTYNLDGRDGVVRKPDSLFMEGIRP